MSMYVNQATEQQTAERLLRAAVLKYITLNGEGDNLVSSPQQIGNRNEENSPPNLKKARKASKARKEFVMKADTPPRSNPSTPGREPLPLVFNPANEAMRALFHR